ncbi:MAG TPA: DUF1559 domain-containing protein [Gemmataceae bacterium]
MHPRSLAGLACAAGLLAALAWPVPAADPADAAKVVAPYLDDQTAAVARLDVAHLDVDAAAERFAAAAGVNVRQIADARRAVREALAAFRKAGASELYAVVSLADLPSPGPFVLAPRAGANDDDLKRALAVLGAQVVEPLDGFMFAGGKTTRDRLRNLTPVARPDLGPALAAVAGAQLQVALVPSADQRRVVAENLQLPPQMGSGPGTILTKGVRWAALGVETKPKLAVKLVAQSDDPAAAAALANAVNKGLDWAAQQNEAKRLLPKIGEMIPALRPKAADSRLTVAVDESSPGVAAAFASLTARARSAAGRQQSMNNLKQLALAWHNYHEVHKAFPPAAIDKDGKPLLSWRVAILPYLDQDALYKEFKLDEPWDSEHNTKLLEKMPAVYRSPAQRVGEWKTTYLAPTGTVGKAHVGSVGARLPDMIDGTSNTVMIVEANDEAAVVWTKPDDLPFDPKEPLKGLIGHYEEGFIAAFADGSVRMIRKTAKPATLTAVFTRDGGEIINTGDL